MEEKTNDWEFLKENWMAYSFLGVSLFMMFNERIDLAIYTLVAALWFRK